MLGMGVSMNPAFSHRRDCRLCGSGNLAPILSLGKVPLANAFPASPAEDARQALYPLDLWLCEQCALAQLSVVIEPQQLFGNYLYVTGTSPTIVAHSAAYARHIVNLLNLQRTDLVVEVASNDGTLLKQFRRYGVRTLGVEPAANLVALARDACVETVNCLFDSCRAEELRQQFGPARVVIANNVLAHVEAPVDFLRGCATLMQVDGLCVVEVPYFRDLVEAVEFDTIYHEHQSYFLLRSLRRLCEAAGLSILRVDRLPVHGGSLRLYLGHRERHPAHASAVELLVSEEGRVGFFDPAFYRTFARQVRRARHRLREVVLALVRRGKRLAAYGAPAKAATLLNYCGLDARQIAFTVDRNPLKVGRFIAGTGIPVLPAPALAAQRPDQALLLAWNYAPEVIRQQAAYLRRGGRFILPLPSPSLVSASNAPLYARRPRLLMRSEHVSLTSTLGAS
jgi:novobiocin biosynthesis protein NovU/D-mycarose 3-C-methyltransferase